MSISLISWYSMLRYKTINKTEAQLRNYACYTNNDEPRQIGVKY